MRVPSKASGVTVYYGEIYIESPGYPNDERNLWTVWDPRPVRQGARMILSGLPFAEAEKHALDLSVQNPRCAEISGFPLECPPRLHTLSDEKEG